MQLQYISKSEEYMVGIAQNDSEDHQLWHQKDLEENWVGWHLETANGLEEIPIQQNI